MCDIARRPGTGRCRGRTCSDPSFRLRRLSRGNEYVSKNNTLSDEITIRRYNPPPDKPQALLPNPASGAQNAASVELIGPSINDSDGDTLLRAAARRGGQECRPRWAS